MPTEEHILAKIKLLMNLANSPNPNEAENARTMAGKLVEKYNITPEELESLKDKKPLYTDDEKLFVTIGLVSWKQNLALTISKQFYCHIIQEECTPAEGLKQYNYFLYGDPEDITTVKKVFNIFNKRIEQYVKDKCIGRGPVFIQSYNEGLVEAINNRIIWDDFELPDVKFPMREREAPPEQQADPGAANIEVRKEQKEKPMKETVGVGGTIIKDIQAYYKGLMDGRDFSIEEIKELEEENEKLKELEIGEDNDKTNSS